MMASASPYTGKVLMAKTDVWHHSVSPPSRQQRLESLTDALRSLADTGLGVAWVLANLHHRRIVPLIERELRIFEMNNEANPMSLAHSRLLHDHLPPEYTVTRARPQSASGPCRTAMTTSGRSSCSPTPRW
jgi:hypothetical protein